MTTSVLVKEQIERASIQLNDNDPQFERWTQRELLLALNDGQRAIAKYMPSSCSRVDAVKLEPGTRQYIGTIPAASLLPSDGSAPAQVFGYQMQRVIRNMGADGMTPGRAVRLADREMIDLVNPGWHTKTGTTVEQYVFDPKDPLYFYAIPGVPTGVSQWVEISYMAEPLRVDENIDYTVSTAPQTKISLADRYCDDLHNYIMARAFMKDAEFGGNLSLASSYTAMLISSINAQVTAMTGVNPNLRSIPGLPSVPATVRA